MDERVIPIAFLPRRVLIVFLICFTICLMAYENINAILVLDSKSQSSLKLRGGLET
jgi:hypothetical protein